MCSRQTHLATVPDPASLKVALHPLERNPEQRLRDFSVVAAEGWPLCSVCEDRSAERPLISSLARVFSSLV